MISEIAVILLLIALNGLFSMAEIALVSVRKSRLESRAQEGDQRAQIALSLAEHPQNFLSTVQCGMTLIGTFAGAYGGATLSKYLEFVFDKIPLLNHYSDAISFGCIVVAITYITIVIGELVPKTIALSHSEGIALLSARPMHAFLTIMYPIVRVLSSSTNAILRIFRIKDPGESEITHDEIQIMLEQGAESGVVNAEEHEMVEGIFRLGNRLINLLMTHRKDVIWLDIHDSTSENLEKMAKSHHSHFPVCDGSLDKVIGMINVKDIMLKVKRGEEIDYGALVTTPLVVPDNLPALRVLSQFKESGTHIALVLDEYGSFQGIVTLNDFMEAIIGEMTHRPGQKEEPLIVPRDNGWLVDGKLENHLLKDLLEVPELFDEERGEYQTLAGMILTFIGRIPNIGDRFAWDKYQFEIVDMDGNRIDRVLITVSAPPTSP